MIRTLPESRHFLLAGKRKSAQDLVFKEFLKSVGWKKGGAKKWDTCWYTGMPEPKVFDQLRPGMSINHIPGNSCLTIKSNLYATIDAARRRTCQQVGEAASKKYEFLPRTFSMPDDYHDFQAEAAKNPGKHWILKPKNASRGRDISLVRDPALIPADEKWLVQEYIDNPHLYEGHKYVLRLYLLITSLDPLRVYLYEEGSVKLASEPYQPEDRDNLFAHLTNPDINATNAGNPSAVVFLSLEKYRGWLRETGVDEAFLFRRIEEMLTLTAVAAREKMLSRVKRVKGDPSGCYELLGIDCLVDAELKPWIMECNLSPSLDICAKPENGGTDEARIKKQLIQDMARLLGLAESGKQTVDLSTEDGILNQMTTECERSGGFKRLVPNTAPQGYLPYFPLPRLFDIILAEAVSGKAITRPTLQQGKIAEIINENSLSLYAEKGNTLITLQDTTAWIWLKATEGIDPDAIAREWVDARKSTGNNANEWETRNHVWSLLADWAEFGMLKQTEHQHGPAEKTNKAPSPIASPTDLAISIVLERGEQKWRLHTGDTAIHSRLMQAFRFLIVEEDYQADFLSDLNIFRTKNGYAVTDKYHLLYHNLNLSQVVPRISEILFSGFVELGSPIPLAGILVPLSKPENTGSASTPAIFVLESIAVSPALLALNLEKDLGYGVAAAIAITPGENERATSLGLPIFALEKDIREHEAIEGAIAHRQGNLPIHRLPSGELAYSLPSDKSLQKGRYKIVQIVLPHRKQGCEGVKPEKIFSDMLTSSGIFKNKNGSAQAAIELFQWISHIPCISANATEGEAILKAVQNKTLASP